MVDRGLVVITFFAALFVGQADGRTADGDVTDVKDMTDLSNLITHPLISFHKGIQNVLKWRPRHQNRGNDNSGF